MKTTTPADWPMEATCLHTSLGMVGNALNASRITSYNEGAVRPNDQVASSLATWLWLWETNDGARWARELGDAWILPLLTKMLVRQVSGHDKVWTLDMELSHEKADHARLHQVINRYRTHARTAWPQQGLNLGHLPALLLLEARPGPRVVPADSRLGPQTSKSPECLEHDPLWLLTDHNDQLLLDWWLSDPGFTPSVINSYRLGYNAQHVLSHRLDDTGWVELWLRHGASPSGDPAAKPSERPLFRAPLEVAKLLLAAGEDPDSLDEQGRLPDEMRPHHGQVVLSTHPIFQAARQALGRTASVAEAHHRHQFAKFALAPTSLSTPLDPDFQRAIKRGPLPRWRSGEVDMGLAEWIARNAREQYANMAAPLLDVARRQLKLKDSLNQVGSAQVPDWAVAHVLAAGMDFKFKTQPGESDALPPLLLPLPSQEAVSHLLRAWTLHGAPGHFRDLLLAKAWPLTPGWAAELVPEHAPAVHALVQSCLPEQDAVSTTWSLKGVHHLAAAVWSMAQDEGQKLDLWSVTVMSPDVDTGPFPGKPVWRTALEQAPEDFWVKLPSTQAWTALRPQLERHEALWPEVMAKVRAATAQQEEPVPSRSRNRPRA